MRFLNERAVIMNRPVRCRILHQRREDLLREIERVVIPYDHLDAQRQCARADDLNGLRMTRLRHEEGVAILGGLDSVGGAVLGGIIIGLLENIAQYVDSQYLHWGNLYEIAPFYVLIIILMIKPYGLFGTKDIERI